MCNLYDLLGGEKRKGEESDQSRAGKKKADRRDRIEREGRDATPAVGEYLSLLNERMRSLNPHALSPVISAI